MLTQECCEMEAKLICENVLQEAKNEKIAVVEFVELIEKECLGELIDVIVETLRKAQNELIAKRVIENQKAEEEATVCYEIVMDWVDAMVEEVGREEVKEVSNRRKQKYLVLAAKASNDLVNEIVREDVGEIAPTAILQVKRERKDKSIKRETSEETDEKSVQIGEEMPINLLARKLQFGTFQLVQLDVSSEEQNSRMGWSKEAVHQRHRSLGSIMQGRQDPDLMIRAKEMEEFIIQSAVLEQQGEGTAGQRRGRRPRIPPVPPAVLTTMELGLTSQMSGLVQYVADELMGNYGVFSQSGLLRQSGQPYKEFQQTRLNYLQSNLSVIL